MQVIANRVYRMTERQVWSGDKKKEEETRGRGETNVKAIVHEIKKIPQNSHARQSVLWPPIHTHTLHLFSFLSLWHPLAPTNSHSHVFPGVFSIILRVTIFALNKVFINPLIKQPLFHIFSPPVPSGSGCVKEGVIHSLLTFTQRPFRSTPPFLRRSRYSRLYVVTRGWQWSTGDRSISGPTRHSLLKLVLQTVTARPMAKLRFIWAGK